jgi:4-amino-4-deoxy-L-arabinose transferase-like glycosyltransferase
MEGLERRRIGVAAVLAAAVLYFSFFSRLDALGVVGPDEPRYAWIARAMAETGDWVTPRLYQQPWFEKPALYYWGAAAAFRSFGENEFTMRLPSAVAATLAALALAWFAWRTFSAATAGVVLLIFPTCVGVFAFARAGTTDMLFSAALTMAMAAGFRAVWGDAEAEHRHRWRWQIAFGALLGVAALAKGPAGVVLAGGTVALWALAAGRWKQAWRLAHPLAVLAFCVVALPWYTLCAMRNPEFLGVFLLSHNIERFLTPVFQHEQPVWFYGPIVLLGLLPWSALLVGAARDAAGAWREKRWKDSPEFFVACWAIFPILFFSVSRSKLPGYILPALAPLALLMARSVARAIEQKDPFGQWLTEWTGITLLVLAGSAGHWLSRYPAQLDVLTRTEIVVWITAVMSAGLIVAGLGWARKLWASLILAAVFMAGLIELVNRRILPTLDKEISPRVAAQVVQAEAGSPGVAAYRLNRAWQYGLNFYLRREIPEWRPPGNPSEMEIVLTSAAGEKELEAAGLQFRVIQRVSQQAVIVRVEP